MGQVIIPLLLWIWHAGNQRDFQATLILGSGNRRSCYCLTTEKIPRAPNISLFGSNGIYETNPPFWSQCIIHLNWFQYVDLSFKLWCFGCWQTFPVSSLVRPCVKPHNMQWWAGHSSVTCWLCTVGQATETFSFLYSILLRAWHVPW